MNTSTAVFPDRDASMRRAGRHALAADVQRSLSRVPVGGVVLVAASGGADSTALAMLAASVAERSGRRLVLATVDHALRQDSAEDADFVEALGVWLGVPVLRRRVTVPAGRQISAAARRARYAAIADMARSVEASSVLLAHHAEDQLETMLMRLARGAGARAAGGMPASRRLCEGVRLRRPLLERSRVELRGLLEDCSVPWREDPGNASQDRTRGHVRHRVLPELAAMAPGAAVRAARAGRRLRGAAGELRRAARTLMPARGPWPRDGLRRAPREVLAEALRLRCTDSGEDQVERCVRAIRGRGTRPRRCRLGSREASVTSREVALAHLA